MGAEIDNRRTQPFYQLRLVPKLETGEPHIGIHTAVLRPADVKVLHDRLRVSRVRVDRL